MSSQNNSKKIIAKNIQHYMNLRGKTRNDICEVLGIKYTTFTDWVKGRSYPRIDSIEKIANYFGIDKSDLIEEHIVDDNLGNKNSSLFYNVQAIPFLDDTYDENNPNFKEYFFIDKSIKADFCMRIQDNIMAPCGIYKGDIVFIKENYVLESGGIYAIKMKSSNKIMLRKIYFNNNCATISDGNFIRGSLRIKVNKDDFSIVGVYGGIYHHMDF
ncbi:MAG: helix-turn-helix domain-containing protein [[Eubacterium] sulci]|jgi:hypothetical protein|nr:helix-turn-helix domain-containing protein [[Eubacterium] sulci]MBF1183246.1 helix-turn-helix domain-containing protein [[Eubacterium] sulci]DAX67241.1 MAG TPA: Repressor protein CI [Bacteriophage sp.]